jgi:plasmid stabilization system protein ParE
MMPHLKIHVKIEDYLEKIFWYIKTAFKEAKREKVIIWSSKLNKILPSYDGS